MSLVEVRDLHKIFPLAHGHAFVHAVNGISFDIERGETVGLVGESGSGKTTAGRLLVDLLKPTFGTITFNGEVTGNLSKREFRRLRSRIQMVFQDPSESLNPRMTCRDTVVGPLRNEGRLSKAEQSNRLSELIELVRLEPSHLDAYPHELSGGQQQRVGIARALATAPDFVVLDEPVSNLDSTVRAEIMDLLAAIQGETGVSYLFISHDLATVEFLSHRVAIMYLGEIVELGATDQIFSEQRHPYSRALLSSVLLPDPDAPHSHFRLEGEIPSPINLPSGCYLASRCPLVVDECVSNHPQLLPISATRSVACWRNEFVPELSSRIEESAARRSNGVLAMVGTTAHEREPADEIGGDNGSPTRNGE